MDISVPRFDSEINVADQVFMEASLPNAGGAACTGSILKSDRAEENIVDGRSEKHYTFLRKTPYTTSTEYPDHTPNKQPKSDKPAYNRGHQYQSAVSHSSPAYTDELPQSSGEIFAGSGPYIPRSHRQHNIVHLPSCPMLDVSNLPSSSNQSNRPTPSYDQMSAHRHGNRQPDAVQQDQNGFYDYSIDLGYSSHSTEGSSCQGQDKDSQQEGSSRGQGSQLDLTAVTGGVAGWQGDGEDGAYLHGENELEDLLYHFKTFFQDRFETELHHFRDSVHGMISEQQTHVRQIVHTAMAERNSQTSTDDPIEDTRVPAASTNPTACTEPRRDCHGDNGGEVTLHPLTSMILSSMGPTRAALSAEASRKQAHLELMSLACSVSTLLTRTEFR